MDIGLPVYQQRNCSDCTPDSLKPYPVLRFTVYYFSFIIWIYYPAVHYFILFTRNAIINFNFCFSFSFYYNGCEIVVLICSYLCVISWVMGAPCITQLYMISSPMKHILCAAGCLPPSPSAAVLPSQEKDLYRAAVNKSYHIVRNNRIWLATICRDIEHRANYPSPSILT